MGNHNRITQKAEARKSPPFFYLTSSATAFDRMRSQFTCIVLYSLVVGCGVVGCTVLGM